MSSYFDEHNCEPISTGQTPNLFLDLARLLAEEGFGENLLSEFQHLSVDDRKPPASQEFIRCLPKVNDFGKEEKCCVCLKQFVANQTVGLSCGHKFHSNCIIPWLQMHNSCPLCRFEFPTDDEEYERNKKEKIRRKQMIDDLHSSMFL